jgi:hypothetical protein
MKRWTEWQPWKGSVGLRDTPQIRDLQFLFTDGKTFFHSERRNLCARVDCISETTLGFEDLK